MQQGPSTSKTGFPSPSRISKLADFEVHVPKLDEI